MMIVVVFFLHIYFSFTKPLYGFCWWLKSLFLTMGAFLQVI